MKIYWAVAKLSYFFYFVDDWDASLNFARAMTSYSDEIDDWLPTTFYVTQYMILSIGNHIVSASLPLCEVSSGLEFLLFKN